MHACVRTKNRTKERRLLHGYADRRKKLYKEAQEEDEDNATPSHDNAFTGVWYKSYLSGRIKSAYYYTDGKRTHKIFRTTHQQQSKYSKDNDFLSVNLVDRSLSTYSIDWENDVYYCAFCGMYHTYDGGGCEVLIGIVRTAGKTLMIVPAVIIVEIIHVPAMFVSCVETIHVFAIYVPLVDTIHAFAVSIVAIILALVSRLRLFFMRLLSRLWRFSLHML